MKRKFTKLQNTDSTLLFNVFTLFIALLFVSNNIGFGQKTLEFNQVKLVTTQETVPDGKVWKITAVLPNYYLTTQSSATTSANTTITYTSYLINNNEIIYSSTHARGRGAPTASSAVWGAFSSTTGVTGIMSVWLPAQTTLEPYSNVYALSVIEFNVNP